MSEDDSTTLVTLAKDPNFPPLEEILMDHTFKCDHCLYGSRIFHTGPSRVFTGSPADRWDLFDYFVKQLLICENYTLAIEPYTKRYGDMFLDNVLHRLQRFTHRYTLLEYNSTGIVIDIGKRPCNRVLVLKPMKWKDMNMLDIN